MKAGIIGSVCFLAYLISLFISVQAVEQDSVEKISVDAFANADIQHVLSLDEIKRIKDAQTSKEESVESKEESVESEVDSVEKVDENKYRRSGQPDTEEEESDLEGALVERGPNRAYAVRAFVYPDRLYGYQNLVQCNSQGEMYYLNLFGDCHICVCAVESFKLVAKCARCDDECGEPDPEPKPEPTPPPTPEPKSECYPFEENVPFENPLNPCQLCLCRFKPFPLGETNVEVACIENPKCVIVSTSTTELPSPTTWTPFPPTTPEPWTPFPPSTPTAPTPTWQPFPPTTTEVATTTLRPPHINCAPFIHNVPYTNPEDDCEICVCREYKNQWATEVETTCKTKPECCLVPNPDPAVIYLSPICRYHNLNEVFVVPGFMCKQFICRIENRHIYLETVHDSKCDNSHLIIPDSICKDRTVGVEFVNPIDRCRVCHCEIFGSVVVPICKKQTGCGELIPTVSANIMIFVAPFCKYQPPNVDVVNGCNVCQCSSVYSFVVSNCRPRGQCENQPTNSGQVNNNNFGVDSSLLIGNNGFGVEGSSQVINNGFGVDGSSQVINNGYGVDGSSQVINSGFSVDASSHNLNNGFAVDASQSLGNQQYYQTLLSGGQLIGNNGIGSASINGQLGNYRYPNVQESSIKYNLGYGSKNNNNGYPNVHESSMKYVVDNGNNDNRYPNVHESSIKYSLDNGNNNNGYPNVQESSIKYTLDDSNNNNYNNNGYPNVKESSIKYTLDEGNNNNYNNKIYPNVKESSIKYTLDYGKNNNNKYKNPNGNYYYGGVEGNNGGWNYNNNKYPVRTDPQVEQIIQAIESDSEENGPNVEALEELFGVDDNNYVNIKPVEISKAKIKSGRPERRK